MDIDRYKANLALLAANSDVVDVLVTSMDEVLQQPSFAFGGQIDGGWVQTVGPSRPGVTEESQATCRAFWQDVVRFEAAQVILELESGTTTDKPAPPGNNAASFAKTVRLVRGRNDASVQRCSLDGLYGITAHTTADQYRVVVPGEDVVHTFTLTRLGGTAVHAAVFEHPTEKLQFVERCRNAFVDRQAVEDLVRGNFEGEEQMGALVERLNAAPDQAELVGRLLEEANRSREAIALLREVNLTMPDRDSLERWGFIVQRLFLES